MILLNGTLLLFMVLQFMLRELFLKELEYLYNLNFISWLICGDFNMIRKRIEKCGKTFEFYSSLKFNNLISHLELYEFSLSSRRFTWSRSINSSSFALFDRFFGSVEWCNHFNTYLVKVLPLIQSDHKSLVVLQLIFFNSHFNIKFDKTWL
jgi:hypothetical protein